MSGERESFGHTTLHAGGDAWVRCATYPATGHLPSLSVDGCGLGVTVYLAGEVINADHVRFARDLAAQAERFAAEAERLHAEAQAASGSKDAAASDVA
jgi:hypothetical protein